MDVMRSRPKDVLVERRQQAHRRGWLGGRQIVNVVSQHEHRLALDRDRGDLTGERCKPATEDGLLREPSSQPAVERVDGRGPVGSQVGGDHNARCPVRFRHAYPGRQPRVETGERHPVGPARPVTEVALPGEGFEDGTPP